MSELARRFRCSDIMVQDALKGLYKSPLANAIREAAKEEQYAPLDSIPPIKVRRGAITELAARFGCGKPTVAAALHGKTRSVLANVIREAAKEERYIPTPPKNGKRPIRLEVGDIPTLAKEFGCSESMVKKSLAWKINSEKADKIRHKAEVIIKGHGDEKPLKTKKGAITTLTQIFGCHYNTAYLAINRTAKSDLQREIRAKAHELGLVIEDENL